MTTDCRANIVGDVPSGKMTAVVLTGPRQITIQRVSIPCPGPDEVLCRVAGVYICGTDPHIVNGDYPGFWPRTYPFIPGHEWAGEVVALGENAARHGWQVGDRVAGTSHCGCGYCRMCMSGRYNLCENYGREDLGHHQYGHYTFGAYADFVVQSIRSVFRVSPDLSWAEAAALDPLSIALHTVKRGPVGPGDSVAILGPGPMGLFVEQCAMVVGAGQVIVIGRGERLAKAAAQGAETVDYTQEDPVSAIRERTDGKGVAVAIDCAGTPLSLAQALGMVQRGGKISVIGIPLEPATLPVQRLVLDEIDLHGVRANRGTCEEVIPLLSRGRLRVGPLHTHTFALAEFERALDTFVNRRDGAIKVLVVPEGR
jgi:L-iditol 2-dehydrogenase